MFDTNVVVSALIFGSNAREHAFGRRLRWLRRSWVSGAVVPVVCRETAAELIRVLAYTKFRLDAAERESLLSNYLPFAEVAHLPAVLPPLSHACRDRNDAVFLQLMIASRADLLVSGDDDLAALAGAYPVVSPATLQQRLACPR